VSRERCLCVSSFAAMRSGSSPGRLLVEYI
jgi:hypothetical protein